MSLVDDPSAEISFGEFVGRRAKFQYWCGQIACEPETKDAADHQHHEQTQSQCLKTRLERRTWNVCDVYVSLPFRAYDGPRDEGVFDREVKFDIFDSRSPSRSAPERRAALARPESSFPFSSKKVAADARCFFCCLKRRQSRPAVLIARRPQRPFARLVQFGRGRATIVRVGVGRVRANAANSTTLMMIMASQNQIKIFR